MRGWAINRKVLRYWKVYDWGLINPQASNVGKIFAFILLLIQNSCEREQVEGFNFNNSTMFVV